MTRSTHHITAVGLTPIAPRPPAAPSLPDYRRPEDRDPAYLLAVAAACEAEHGVANADVSGDRGMLSSLCAELRRVASELAEARGELEVSRGMVASAVADLLAERRAHQATKRDRDSAIAAAALHRAEREAALNEVSRWRTEATVAERLLRVARQANDLLAGQLLDAEREVGWRNAAAERAADLIFQRRSAGGAA